MPPSIPLKKRGYDWLGIKSARVISGAVIHRFLGLALKRAFQGLHSLKRQVKQPLLAKDVLLALQKQSLS